MPFQRRKLPKFNEYSYDVETSSEGKLLPPQSEALRRLQTFFEENPTGRIALISMPTGSGKSGVISCLPYFLGTSGLDPPRRDGDRPDGEPLHRFDKPVLVIAPDLAIASQLEDVLTVSPDAPTENFLIKRGIVPREAKEARPNGVKIKETAHLDSPEFLADQDIVITNVHKFLEDNNLPADFFKLVIVDEAHHHPASMWRRIVQRCKNHAMVVFFTATPFRGDNKPVLPEEGEVVYHLSLKKARTDRIIRDIWWEELRTNLTNDEDLNSIYRLILERVKCIQEAKNREKPLPGNIPHMAIAITNNIVEAEQVAILWNTLLGSTDSAVAYHSKIKPKEWKKELLKQIRSNKFKLVVVVEMLLEGFDHPPISIAAIMTKITSRVKFAQFLGRAQRIVRGQEGSELESDEILSDVITHSRFKQEANYQAYEDEEPLLIPDD